MSSLDTNAAPSAPPPRHGGKQPPGRGRRRFGLRTARLDYKVSPYLYIAPFFILFAIFGLYPTAYTIWLSFTDTSPLNPETNFVGLENYSTLLGDPNFWNSVVNTLGIFVLATVPQLLMALILANWLNRRLRGVHFFRAMTAIPIVTSTAVVSLIFGLSFFARDFGLANGLLELVGVEPIDWRAEKWSSWLAISSMVDWRWTGYNALIYLAGMQAIPNDLYEAAEIDGASRARQFWQITVPLLRPTIIFTVIISTIFGLQLFAEPVMFTSGSGALGGGSLGQFQTVTMFVVEALRVQNRWGYAATAGLALLLMIIAVAAINFLLIRRLGSER
jgi:cellobiose transport system permease protein